VRMGKRRFVSVIAAIWQAGPLFSTPLLLDALPKSPVAAS
jgi:hypothetical protein